MSEWDDMIAQRKDRNSLRDVQTKVRRQMWSELGFMWTTFAFPFGNNNDICLSMGTLNTKEREIFDEEFERRVNIELNKELRNGASSSSQDQ